MTKFVSVVFAIAIGLALLTVSGMALARQLPCIPYDEAVKRHAERHGEAPIAMGLAANGMVFQVFATEDGETWSLVIATPDGRACLAASGEWWQAMEFALPGQES